MHIINRFSDEYNRIEFTLAYTYSLHFQIIFRNQFTSVLVRLLSLWSSIWIWIELVVFSWIGTSLVEVLFMVQTSSISVTCRHESTPYPVLSINFNCYCFESHNVSLLMHLRRKCFEILTETSLILWSSCSWNLGETCSCCLPIIFHVGNMVLTKWRWIVCFVCSCVGNISQMTLWSIVQVDHVYYSLF